MQRLRGGRAPTSHGGLRAEADAPRDVFGGESLAETTRLEPLVRSLVGRTAALLEAWPGHPALVAISTLCERLHSFRADSPLMQLLTGCELLLKRCWEWEAVACRETSIKPQIDALAALVLRWRRMEVDAWPALLRRAAERAHDAALLKIWARLFHVVNSHLWADSSAAAADDDAADSSAAAADDDAADASAAGADAADAADADRAAHLAEFFETFQRLLLTAEAGAFDACAALAAEGVVSHSLPHPDRPSHLHAHVSARRPPEPVFRGTPPAFSRPVRLWPRGARRAPLGRLPHTPRPCCAHDAGTSG